MQQRSLSIVNLLTKTSFSLVCPFLSCDQRVWHLCVIPSSLVVLLLSHGRLVHTPLALVASFRRHSQLSRVHANKSSVRIYLPAIVLVWPPKLYKSVANVLRGLSGLYHNRVNISKSTRDCFFFSNFAALSLLTTWGRSLKDILYDSTFHSAVNKARLWLN